jgi:beta-xylosidase
MARTSLRGFVGVGLSILHLAPSTVFGLPPLALSRALVSKSEPWTNPIVDGWYADPDGVKFGESYWIYATLSIAFDNQTSFDAFESQDLVTWTKHEGVFSADNSAFAKNWLWAPCTVERDGKYYFYYTANNPIDNEGTAGVGVAVADSPGGPFLDLIDHPIVDKHINGADAMDPQVFIDDDGSYYLIWGGTRSNIAPLNADMASLGTWPDGSGPIEITPNEGYTEGSYMLKREGWYYYMWSEGGYGTPDYRVAYAMSQSITGPFDRIGLILSKDDVVADGPGHHGVISDDDGTYYIVYHRRIIGDSTADNRVLAIDVLSFNPDGTIQPVVMT